MNKTILILGGGFVGVCTAIYLEKLMTAAERAATDIVIASRDNFSPPTAQHALSARHHPDDYE
jgi:glycine/D-amino acid oxidase-like deaminating enzyme